jgi:hypothetical protein
VCEVDTGSRIVWTVLILGTYPVRVFNISPPNNELGGIGDSMLSEFSTDPESS